MLATSGQYKRACFRSSTHFLPNAQFSIRQTSVAFKILCVAILPCSSLNYISLVYTYSVSSCVDLNNFLIWSALPLTFDIIHYTEILLVQVFDKCLDIHLLRHYFQTVLAQRVSKSHHYVIVLIIIQFYV